MHEVASPMILPEVQWQAKSVSLAHPSVNIPSRKHVKAQVGNWRAAREPWRMDNKCGIEKAGCVYAVRSSSCNKFEHIFDDERETDIRIVIGYAVKTRQNAWRGSYGEEREDGRRRALACTWMLEAEVIEG